MANRIQLRRDTSANWATINPILADGEPGLEIDTNKIKYGDGTHGWVSLSYSGSSDPTRLVNGSSSLTLNPNGDVTLAGSLNWPHMSLTYTDNIADSALIITDGQGGTYTFEKLAFNLGDNIELGFGSNAVVTADTSGNVSINANGENSIFGIDGTLTLPGNIKIGNLDGSVCVQSSRYYLYDLLGTSGASSTVISYSNLNNIVSVGDNITDGHGNTYQVTGITGTNPNWTIATSWASLTPLLASPYSFSKPNNTGGLWQFGPDGMLTLPGDIISSGNGLAVKTGQTTGNIFGGSLKFIGTGTILLTPGIVVGGVEDTGIHAFTIDAWVKFSTDPATNYQYILGSVDDSGLSLFVGNGQAGPSATTITIDSLGNDNTEFTVPTLTTGTWYHIAVARNSSGLATVWVNGQRSTSGAVSLIVPYNGPTHQLGSWSYNNTSEFTGNIGQIRVVGGNNLYDPTHTIIPVPNASLENVSGTQLLLLMPYVNPYQDATGNNTLTLYSMAGSVVLPNWQSDAPSGEIDIKWTFGTDGNLTLPTGGSIYGQYFIGGEGTNVQTDQTTNQINIQTYNTSSYTSKVWTFRTDGSLTFPDSTVQSSAYQFKIAKTTFNVANANIQIDNAQFSFNNSGNPTVAAVSGTWSGPWTAEATIWNGTSFVTTTYGSTSATWTSIAAYGFGVTFGNAGDQVIAHFTDNSTGHIYKVSWFASASAVTTNCTIIVERVI